MSQGLGGRSYCPLLERLGHVTALADDAVVQADVAPIASLRRVMREAGNDQASETRHAT